MTDSNSRSNSASWVKSSLLTTLFCLLIAITTQTIWGGDFFGNVIISLGFGYSALVSSFVIAKLFPKVSRLVETILSMIIAISVGTINAQFWINGYFDYNFSEMKSVVLLGVIFCGMCYYYFYTKEQKMLAEHELEVAKRRQADQEKVVVVSQLKQLQSQIEPHFLFNTLANISALIESDSDKAKLMLEKLTDLLRATLKNSRNESSTVGQELALNDAYLNIQKIRLGERLAFSITALGVDDTQALPPFLIQPLVENALTHGIEPSVNGGCVDIEISSKEGMLTMTVSDNGVGLNAGFVTTGHGVALDNIRQRINTLFEGRAKMTIIENGSGGVTSSISIPMEMNR
ncbi:histidine kinase [Vibrio makurazakiensis]|uniref:sensor histidine kinase n=1 Tax=Vibrio makurazakiensis TaxID=2910250 RepID=UPI003D150401